MLRGGPCPQHWGVCYPGPDGMLGAAIVGGGDDARGWGPLGRRTGGGGRRRELAIGVAGRPRTPGRPDRLLDLAVPRDADRRCGDVEGVTVLELDKLRRDARDEYPWPPAVERAVRRDTAAFTADTRGLAVEPTIVAFRARAEELRRAVLERAGAHLTDLDDRERAAVEVLTRQLVAAMLHEPTVAGRQEAGASAGLRSS
jgi:hypothetical protein